MGSTLEGLSSFQFFYPYLITYRQAPGRLCVVQQETETDTMPSNAEEGTQEKGTTPFHANAVSIDELRRAGNSYFSQGDYDSALSLYSSAIEQSSSLTDKNNLILNLCNRSACFFKMERYEEARNDALEAVKKTEEENSAITMTLVSVEKAIFRLARAEIALQNYKGAIECLEKFLSSSTSEETSELQKLLNYARNMEKNGSQDKPAWNASNKKVLTPSIKEFEIHKLLGEGNFSSIYSCQHKETKRVFALKVIEKKKVESLAKREHPNAYNEVNMERRVLGERLRSSDHPTHPFVIHMYHAFQDYQNLYLLMDLHEGELWSCIRYQGKLVGCHASLVRFYLAELVEVLEYIHSKGIVHRDLKAENVRLHSFSSSAQFFLRLCTYMHRYYVSNADFDCQDWSYCLNRLRYRQRFESN
jgi:tetratricopeptide (TPR) repeat protein